MHETFEPFLSRVEVDPVTGNLFDPLQVHQYQIGKSERLLGQKREPDAITFGNVFESAMSQAKPKNQNIHRIEQSDRTIPNHEFNLSSLNSHRRELPDATVYVPPGFDATKPVNVVIYNHGRYNTANGDFNKKELKEQMVSAPPNSILIVPAWQQVEGSDKNSVAPKFRKHVVDMVAHAVNQTGKTLDDIGSIQIVSHSAGFVPANIELAALKDSPLYDRITSVANLDAHYGRQPQVDEWIHYNIGKGRFASGEVSYLNVFNSNGSPKQVSMGQVDDVSKWAGNQRLVGRGYRNGRITADPRAGSYPIAFVEVSDSHGVIPNKHFTTALNRAPRTIDTKIGAR